VILNISLDLQAAPSRKSINRGGFSMYLLHVNVLAVLAAAVIQWFLGWIWYGMLFKKDWTALVFKENAQPSNAGGVMALIFIANLILSFALVKIEALTGWTSWGRGSLVGAICGLGFVVPPMFAQHIAEKQPFKLFGINALYWLIAMYFSGGLLAVWR
jgi:magnesium-transporting ATPase (P-type)